MSASLQIETVRSSQPASDERRAEILASPGFGKHFTDHMLTASWTPQQGWHDARLRAYAPFEVNPASAVLHYAQEVFEGLKAYRHDDGSVWSFRPEVNAARFARSARRMALPELPEDDFVAAVDALVQTDHEWVPSGGETSLYLRPFMFASEVFLGVRPAQHVTFCVIASPAGAYFAKGVKPVSIWLSEDYIRAAPGGTGSAKCGGNYAASLQAQQEALAHDCDQVVFLDAVDRRWVEELGGMNLFFVYADGQIVTPALTDSILEGVTRDSVLALARSRGYDVTERRVSIDDWFGGVASGEITEVFACGTAAVITPVGTLKWSGGEVSSGDDAGKVTSELRSALLDVQYGRSDEMPGWMHRIV
ncbi:MAG: branched-chain amino acid aminotransferase [Actinomycetota bacterium]|nr:branched-chain amino acid aminotransferase [Actinomycetota bacterium]